MKKAHIFIICFQIWVYFSKLFQIFFPRINPGRKLVDFLNFQTLFFQKVMFCLIMGMYTLQLILHIYPILYCRTASASSQRSSTCVGFATFLPFPAHACFSRAGDEAGTAWYSCNFCFVKYFYLVRSTCMLFIAAEFEQHRIHMSWKIRG